MEKSAAASEIPRSLSSFGTGQQVELGGQSSIVQALARGMVEPGFQQMLS